MSEPICSKDCFNCPFPDCINDTFDAEDRAASEDVERDFVQSKTKKQLQNAAYRRNRTPEQKAKQVEAYRKWREEHREEYRAYRRQYYARNKEHILAYQKAQRDAGKYGAVAGRDRRDYYRAYYQKNREILLAKAKAKREAKKRKENENAQSLSDRC